MAAHAWTPAEALALLHLPPAKSMGLLMAAMPRLARQDESGPE